MTTEYSRADVKAHNKSTDCWIIYKGEVFDVTQFLNKHPGGEDSLLECGGADATSSFNDIGHSSSALNQMKKFKIGVLKKEEYNAESESKQDQNSASCCVLQ